MPMGPVPFPLCWTHSSPVSIDANDDLHDMFVYMCPQITKHRSQQVCCHGQGGRGKRIFKGVTVTTHKARAVVITATLIFGGNEAEKNGSLGSRWALLRCQGGGVSPHNPCGGRSTTQPEEHST